MPRRIPGSGLAKGLAVTLRTMTKKTVTAQYPDVQPELPPRTRGVIGAVRGELHGLHAVRPRVPRLVHLHRLPQGDGPGRGRRAAASAAATSSTASPSTSRSACTAASASRCVLSTRCSGPRSSSTRRRTSTNSPTSATSSASGCGRCRRRPRSTRARRSRRRSPPPARPPTNSRPPRQSRRRPSRPGRRGPAGTGRRGPPTGSGRLQRRSVMPQAALATAPHGFLSPTGVEIAFLLVGIATLGAAVITVTTRQLVHAALWLVVALGGLAVEYLLLTAEFIAWVQVLIYVGSVVVLLLFGLMLTKAPIGRSPDADSGNRWVGARGGRRRGRRPSSGSSSTPSARPGSTWTARPRAPPRCPARSSSGTGCCPSRRCPYCSWPPWSARSCCPARTAHPGDAPR